MSRRMVPPSLRSVDTLALAIGRYEGWNPSDGRTTRAERNNNPGNLWNPSRSIYRDLPRDDKGFIVFPTEAAGWTALRRQIEVDAGRGLSLRQFIYKYAPPTENNTSAYLSYVMGKLGLASSDVSLRSLQPTPASVDGSGVMLAQAGGSNAVLVAAAVGVVSLLTLVL